MYCALFVIIENATPFGIRIRLRLVHQKSIIRIVSSLQVIGSDLLFISRLHKKQGLLFCKSCSFAIKI